MPRLKALDEYGDKVLYNAASVNRAEVALFTELGHVSWGLPQTLPLATLGLSYMTCERRHNTVPLSNVDVFDQHRMVMRGIQAEGLYDIGLGSQLCMMLSADGGGVSAHSLEELGNGSELVKFATETAMLIVQCTKAEKFRGVYHQCAWSVLNHKEYSKRENKERAKPRYLFSIKIQQQGIDTRVDVVRAVQWQQSFIHARPLSQFLAEARLGNTLPMAILNACCTNPGAAHPTIEAFADHGSPSAKSMLLHRANVAMHILTGKPPSSESATRFFWELHGQQHIAMAWSDSSLHSSTSRIHFQLPNMKPSTLALMFCDPEFREACPVNQPGMSLIGVHKAERAPGTSETHYTATYTRVLGPEKSTCESVCVCACIHMGEGNHVAIQWPVAAATAAAGRLTVQEEMFVVCSEKGDGCDVRLYHVMKQPLDSALSVAGRRLDTLVGKLLSSGAVQRASETAEGAGVKLDVSYGAAPVEAAFMSSLARFLESRAGRRVAAQHAGWGDPFNGPCRWLLQPVEWMGCGGCT